MDLIRYAVLAVIAVVTTASFGLGLAGVLTGSVAPGLRTERFDREWEPFEFWLIVAKRLGAAAFGAVLFLLAWRYVR